MSPPKLTLAQNRLLRNARKACEKAERLAENRKAVIEAAAEGQNVAILDGCKNSIFEEHDDTLNDAALALLYAAIAHCTSNPGKRPKTMMWLGRRWYLVVHASGDLEVQAYQGIPGVMSCPAGWPGASL